MTDVWCEDKYCIHNLVGKCSLDSIGLKMYDRMLSCAQYDAELASTNYQHVNTEEEETELPSVSLQESIACDEHNGRTPKRHGHAANDPPAWRQ